MGSRHVPTRRCVACGARAPKPDLARFVVEPCGDGWRLARDDRATRPGRGLYVCAGRACFEVAVARRAFARAARLRGATIVVDAALADALD